MPSNPGSLLLDNALYEFENYQACAARRGGGEILQAPGRAPQIISRP